MYAGGGQSNERVAVAHGAAVQYPLLIHEADGKAGEVVFVLGIEAGHFGGLAAYERGSGLDAALRHALDDIRDALRYVLAAGDVVQEKERLCAGADDIVHAHGHAVYAHRVVLVHQEGELELRTHAVGAGDQHRGSDARQVRLEQSAEAAETPDDAGDGGACDVLLHKLHGPVARSDVHARGPVAFTLAPHSEPSFRPIFCSNLDFCARQGGSQGYSPVKQPLQKPIVLLSASLSR